MSLRSNSKIRLLAGPFWSIYIKVLAKFPIAKVPGAFLSDPLPVTLVGYSAVGAPNLEKIAWQLVTSDQFKEPSYTKWLVALGQSLTFHRKQWEWIYILQVLDHFGKLSKNSKGVGFGSGKEPLPSLMASCGCEVLSTDLHAEDAAIKGWVASNQHGSQLTDFFYPNICNPEIFKQRVAFRSVDMNNIPHDISGFDFLWSSCSLEHLGSLENGINFVKKSMACLRPGGVAVHTTEFNLASDDETYESEATSIYRKQDIIALAEWAIENGYEIGLINFTPGCEPPDLHIDTPPYSPSLHLRRFLRRHLITSIGFFIRRKTID